MTRKDALTAVLANVEAGVWEAAGIGFAFAFDDEKRIAAKRAFHGSLDAAKALHEAVLPGADAMLAIGSGASSCVIAAPYREGVRTRSANHEDPARAWLIALIETLIAKEDDA